MLTAPHWFMLYHIPPFPSICPHQVAVHAFCHSASLLCIFHSQLIHPSSFSCFPPVYPFVHISFLSSFVVPPSASQARLIIRPSIVFMDLVYLSTCLPSPLVFSWIYPYSHAFPHTHLLAFLTGLPPRLPCFSQSSLNAIHPHIKHSSPQMWFILWPSAHSSLPLFFLLLPSSHSQSSPASHYSQLIHFPISHPPPSVSFILRAQSHTHMFTVQSKPIVSVRLFLRKFNYIHASFSPWSYSAHPHQSVAARHCFIWYVRAATYQSHFFLWLFHPSIRASSIAANSWVLSSSPISSGVCVQAKQKWVIHLPVLQFSY